MNLTNIKWWIVLSTDWKLENVQAGLVVIISVLAFVAVFTSARLFWHSSAKRISKNADVPISSLLSFTTLGEVFDVVILLKSKLLHSKHMSLAVQCLLVVAFSVCAIFAGPISRYGTRVGERDSLRSNHGLIATQSYTCEINNSARWHNISLSLDQANFPHDQMLDYLPDTKSNWVYHAEDWNATYSAKCSVTTEANLTLEAIGNYTTGRYYIYDNVPGLSEVFSSRILDNATMIDWYYSGTRNPSKNIWESMIFYHYAEARSEPYSDDNPTQQLSVHLSTIAMHDVPMSKDPDYPIGKGQIPAAWYTKVECDLTRNLPSTHKSNYSAWIDTPASCFPTQNMDQYFSASIMRPRADEVTDLLLPNGDDLIRYYQAYTISKDTHYPHLVTRNINLRVATVEISSVFIAVMSLIAFLVLVGLLHCLVCRVAYRDLYKSVPETKVDWLLQSLREAEGQSLNANGNDRRSLTSENGADGEDGYHHGYRNEAQGQNQGVMDDIPRKNAWEKARYSLSNPHYSPSVSTEGHTPTTNGFGRVSLRTASLMNTNTSRTPSPAPSSLIPSPPTAPPFSNFINKARGGYGYSPLPPPSTTPSPPPMQTLTQTQTQAPYPLRSTTQMTGHSDRDDERERDRVISYGNSRAKITPVLTVPGSERREWEVGVVENRG